MTSILVPRQKTVTVRQEATRVLLFVEGQLALDIPWDGALELARALHVQAKRAEEVACASQVIADQALAMRAGLPVGFTSNPAMQREAGKEAAWDSALRRYLPGREVAGELYPFVVNSIPRKGTGDAPRRGIEGSDPPECE